VSKSSLIRSHKRCDFIETAGQWPWKSASAKKCVTTYQPNEIALKMDDAETKNLYLTVKSNNAIRAKNVVKTRN